MPVCTTSPVSEDPQVLLLQWRIMRANPGATLHFVGRKATSYSGRVSSAIVSFDADCLRGSTVSGRVYQLVGPDGFDGVSEYVWHQWCVRNAVQSSEDVTVELIGGAQP